MQRARNRCPRRAVSGRASDPVPRVLDRADPTTMGTRNATAKRTGTVGGGGSAPLTLNLLPPKNARGLPNLARIPRSGWPVLSSLPLDRGRVNSSVHRAIRENVYTRVSFVTPLPSPSCGAACRPSSATYFARSSLHSITDITRGESTR